MAKRYKLVEHQFGAHETVHAVLRYYNDNNMTEEELYLARVYFFNENTDRVCKSGDVVQIPILPQYQED